MDGEVKKGRVLIEQVLRAISMMHIPVQHHHSLHRLSKVLQSILGSYAYVIQ